MIDVNPMRDAILEAFPMPNVDGAYCFYYDETNNVRKLHLTPDGMNIRRPDCFVLGGIVHGGAATIRAIVRRRDNRPGPRSGARADQDRAAVGLCSR